MDFTWKSIFVNFTLFKNLHPIWLPTTPIHSKVPKDDEEDSSTNNECDSCGKSFDTSNYLNRHIYQVHCSDHLLLLQSNDIIRM